MFSLTLIAAGGQPAGALLDRPEFLYATAGLVGALLVGAVVIYLIDRWRKRAALDDRAAGQELTSFRAMYERGEITEQEYAHLRQKVAARVKAPAAPAAEAGLPPAQPATPGVAVTGPLPPGYFDEPELKDRPPGENRPGGGPPPA